MSPRDVVTIDAQFKFIVSRNGNALEEVDINEYVNFAERPDTTPTIARKKAIVKTLEKLARDIMEEKNFFDQRSSDQRVRKLNVKQNNQTGVRASSK